MIQLAIDTMGGDFGPRVTVPASLNAIIRNPSLQLHLVGQQQLILPWVEKRRLNATQRSRIHFVHTPDVVEAHHKPAYVLRRMQKSSMYAALELVSNQQVQGCISAGNTGALMALGRLLIKTLPGIDRPAIIGFIPTLQGYCLLLDLGANIQTTPDQLVQFAHMGSAMASALRDSPLKEIGVSDAVVPDEEDVFLQEKPYRSETSQQAFRPRVALLNVGVEDNKGNPQVQKAAQLLRLQNNVHFIGYIEGDQVFNDCADVVVCDGFVGNIALKSNEGLARFIANTLRKSFNKNLYRQLLGYLCRPILAEIQTQLDPGRRNGACLLGLQKVVIKSHGGADELQFECAIQQAVRDVEMDIPRKIADALKGEI